MTRTWLSILGAASVVFGLAGGASAYESAPQGWSYGYGTSTQAPPIYSTPSRSSRTRAGSEMAILYATSVAYGVGIGIWIDAEIGIEDPALLLIPPAVLGIGAPVGAYFLDKPHMHRGVPAAISAGMVLGASEGLGIAGTQFVIAKKEDAWGFKGLSRSVALGATLGGVGGYAFGTYEEPSPKLSAFVTSGAVWGTAIGSSIAYGASEGGIGYGRANDSAAIGGLVGLNVGLAATAGLSALFVPTWYQIGWMWGGAAIGAAVSLPVFLLYAGADSPAKRGFIFTGTAIALGIAAAGIFTSGDVDLSAKSDDGWPTIVQITPMRLPGGAGLALSGLLE